jgi:hypothetical protein
MQLAYNGYCVCYVFGLQVKHYKSKRTNLSKNYFDSYRCNRIVLSGYDSSGICLVSILQCFTTAAPKHRNQPDNSNGVAAFSLLLDFNFMRKHLPQVLLKYMEWYGAFGLDGNAYMALSGDS